jgi:hypothetical protein
LKGAPTLPTHLLTLLTNMLFHIHILYLTLYLIYKGMGQWLHNIRPTATVLLQWQRYTVPCFLPLPYGILCICIACVQRWASKIFFKSSLIANPPILGLIPQSQSVNFLGVPVCKSHPQFFMIYLQVANLQISTHTYMLYL